MALQTKNWALSSYTNATWTDLVAEPATIATITIANAGSNSVVVQLRVEDGGASVAIILPAGIVYPDESYTIDVRSLNLTGTQALQIQADMAGVEFFASGVVSV